MLWTFHRLDGQGRVTGPVGWGDGVPDVSGMTYSLVPQPACLTRGAIGRSPPYGRGEVLGWARALSPRSGLGGFPGFLVPPCVIEYQFELRNSLARV